MILLQFFKSRFALYMLLFNIILSGQSLYADRNVVIDSTTSWGTWEGWGCSLCWWAAEFGNRDDLADILFTMNYTMLNGNNMPGLGMTYARYNAGACSWNSFESQTMQESPNIYATRQMEGFWLDWYSTDPNSSSWDWTVDSKQRQMVIKARDRGATHFELFSNSPMWWMCYNNNPSGADNGADDNLQSNSYNDHAIYMATIAKYFYDNWQIEFTTVDPFNEPIATWWSSTGTQEGCHFDNSTQAAVIGHLRTELDNRGLNTMPIAASDESTYDMALDTWKNFDSNTKSLVDQINVHGYQYSGGPRQELYFRLCGRKLWNSEYGESDGSGLSLAENLCRDLRYLHPTSWSYWQPLDWADWGLIDANLEDSWIGNPENKYYVLAQFTRHIRPGFIIIDGGMETTVAAYDPGTRKLVLVTLNNSVGESFTYDLSNFSNVTGPVNHWRTHIGSGDKYVQQTPITLTSKSFTVWIDENCVQTFVVENVDQPLEFIGVTPQPGYWYKLIARHSGKCLEVEGDETSIADGINVQQWEYQDEHNQQWMLEDAGDGYYRLTPRHAQDKSLNVQNGSTSDAANLEQYTYDGSTYQKWKLIPAKDGYFAIMSQNSEKGVDINGYSTDNGANAIQWPCKGDDNQLWEFIELEPVCQLISADGDLDGSCLIDLYDFAILGQYWMQPCGGSPLEDMFGGTCNVDYNHLRVLADNWMTCGWLNTELCSQ